MMGRKALAGKLFDQVSLEDLVPAGHLPRRIADAIDFGVARRLTARCYSHTGQPSVDTAVLCTMPQLGCLRGLPSERQLIEKIRLNLAYRRFVGYDPEESILGHTVRSKARRRFGPIAAFQDHFSELKQELKA